MKEIFNKNKRSVIGLLIIFLPLFYFNTNSFIHSQEWKNVDGSSVGDWIEFDDTLYILKWRTVYKTNIPTGKIIFCYGKGLVIKEIETGEFGYYTNKSLFR